MTKIVTSCEQTVAASTDSTSDMATNQSGPDSTGPAQSLRCRAELQAGIDGGRIPESFSHEDTLQLLHELQVHQFELEMQNEELSRVQVQLEASRSRYYDLYDQAPIGYLTVSNDGSILEANPASAVMLGTTRNRLVSQPLFRFIYHLDRDIYNLRRKSFLETHTPEIWEMRMLKANGSMFWCRLQAIQSQTGEILITLSDYSENKQAIKELQESEERHRLLANTMLQGVVHQDANGKIIMMNPAAERILGKTRDQFLGSSSVQEEHHTIRENGAVFSGNEHPSMVALQTGQPVQGEIMGVFNPRLGEYRWISIDAVPVFRANETRPSEVYTVFEDITERKQKDQAIRLGKQEWERTFDSVPDLIAIIDSKHRITRVNKAMANRLGLNPQECIGQPCFTAVHGTGIPPEFCIHAKSMSDGTGCETELHGTEMGGDFLVTTTPLFSDQGEVYATVHVARDITIQKRIETALRENEEQLKLFIEHAPAALAMFDRDMRYLRLSSRWRSDYGLGDRDVLGLSHYEVFPEISANWKEAHRRALAGEVLRAEAERFERADGSLQWVRWEIRPWFDSAGKVGGIVIFAEEITDLKQAEAELRSAHDNLELRVAERTRQLEQTYSALILETQEKLHATEALRKQEHILIQQNRHAAMGEMIGNIAHQWRQPLNTLGLFIQRLGFFYGTPSFDKELLESSIAKSMEIIQYMSRTIDDFRNFFSTEREKTDFKVNEAVSKALSLVEASFKECKIDIVREDRAEVIIYGFANEYSQVLLNILINAKDALIEKQIAIPRLKICIGTENGVSVVTVADNAGGVSEDIIDKIFDPYFTTKGPQQGTGIGLFMSKTIIENKMGGRLTVHNTSEGAEFRIEV